MSHSRSSSRNGPRRSIVDDLLDTTGPVQDEIESKGKNPMKMDSYNSLSPDARRRRKSSSRKNSRHSPSRSPSSSRRRRSTRTSRSFESRRERNPPGFRSRSRNGRDTRSPSSLRRRRSTCTARSSESRRERNPPGFRSRSRNRRDTRSPSSLRRRRSTCTARSSEGRRERNSPGFRSRSRNGRDTTHNKSEMTNKTRVISEQQNLELEGIDIEFKSLSLKAEDELSNRPKNGVIYDEVSANLRSIKRRLKHLSKNNKTFSINEAVEISDAAFILKILRKPKPEIEMAGQMARRGALLMLQADLLKEKGRELLVQSKHKLRMADL